MAKSFTTLIGRLIGFGCGLLLVLVGFALLATLPQDGGASSLISVLVALGVGVIAASLLPNSIVVRETRFKPLGLSLTASGGAAFFVVTLVFLFYAQGQALKAMAMPAPAAGASAEPTPLPGAGPTGDPAALTPAASVAPDVAPMLTASQPQADTAEATAAMARIYDLDSQALAAMVAKLEETGEVGEAK